MAAKRNMLACPNCGQMVEAQEDDVIDINFFQDEMSMFCVGHCPKCKAQFQWDAMFKFSHVKDIEFYGEFEDEGEDEESLDNPPLMYYTKYIK